MSIFKKLFGGKDASPKPEKPKEVPKEDAIPSYHTVELLLEHYGGLAYEKQIRFHEVLGSMSWEFDMQKGQIVFGGQHRIPVQVIGTYSKSQETFMWSWANVHSNIPDYQLKQAKALKQYGEDHGVVEFFDPTFAADLKICHAMCLVAVGMFRSSCYYFADFGQGLLLLTLSAPIVDAAEKKGMTPVLQTFPQLISGFELNHRPTLVQYLKAKGFAVEEGDGSLKGRNGAEIVEAKFDELGRMTKLTGGNTAE